MTELWTALFEPPTAIARLAKEREAQGWDGAVFGDTPYFLGDPYALMAAAAVATSRLRLATAVTNTASRDTSVTAAAISTVHAISGGRAVLGIGRGDSAVANLGLRPLPGARFAADLARLRTLLHGGSVETPSPPAPLGTSGAAREARMTWLDPGLAPPPIEVYGSGPRTIELAARIADRLTISVGADPERAAWATATARAAERDPALAPLRTGLTLVVAPHEDLETALALAAGYAATHARFAAMGGRAVGAMASTDAATVGALARTYDLSSHGNAAAEHATALDREFLARFAVVGRPEDCVRRLLDLVAGGLDHLVLIPPGKEGATEARSRSLELLNEAVLPALREALAA